MHGLSMSLSFRLRAATGVGIWTWPPEVPPRPQPSPAVMLGGLPSSSLATPHRLVMLSLALPVLTLPSQSDNLNVVTSTSACL